MKIRKGCVNSKASLERLSVKNIRLKTLKINFKLTIY